MNIEKEYGGKVVLVTGGAGAIGTNLCKKLDQNASQKETFTNNFFASKNLD